MELHALIENLSSSIIVASSIIGALYAIITRGVLPLTAYGQRRIEQKKQQRNTEVEVLAECITERAMTPVLDEVKGVKNDIKEIWRLNEDQTESINSIYTMVDENERDRIRWEIMSFARLCQSGHTPQRENFNHIFEIHDKYVEILQRLGKSNGQITENYKIIEQYYEKLYGSPNKN